MSEEGRSKGQSAAPTKKTSRPKAARKKAVKKKASKKKAAKKKASKKKAAKKKASTKKAAKKKARRKGRGGGSDRKPGPGAAWTHTNPVEIQAFRSQHGLSEAGTARALGVSVGTLRNWTLHGKSAMAKTQKAVKKAMDAYRPGGAPAPKRGKAAAQGGRARAPRAMGSAQVAEIVIAYIRRGGEIRGDLVEYIERVKGALQV